MTTSVSNEALSNAIVQAVETGAYPEEEVISSSEVGPVVLPNVLKELGAARNRVQSEIKQLSQDVAPDIDGWIQQAKQLQVDIERSRSTARNIIREAEEASRLRDRHEDLSTKVRLLTEEVDYTKKLEKVLSEIQSVANGLNKVKNATQEGDIHGALNYLEEVEARLVVLRPYDLTLSVDLLTQRAERLRKDLIETAWQQLDDIVQVDYDSSTIIVQSGSGAPPLDVIVDTCARLALLEPIVLRLSQDIDEVLLKPKFAPRSDGRVAHIERADRQLRIQQGKPISESTDAIHDILSVATFFQDLLPAELSAALSERLMPTVLSHLLTTWVPAALPLAVQRTQELQSLLDRLSQLSMDLAKIGWNGQASLNEWVDSVPRHWLSKRREQSLASVRSMLSKQIRESKIVERVETQTVSRDDVIAPADSENEDWNAGWSDDGKAGQDEIAATDASPQEDDEDTSAWDVGGEDAVDSGSPTKLKSEAATSDRKEGPMDDEVEAWGWNEADSASVSHSPVATRNPVLPPRPVKENHNQERRRSSTQRQLTLKETYTTTLVPENLLELITAIIHDADTLRSSSYSRSPISSAASALNSLPTLIIASFRALAPAFYHIESPTPGAGNMYMYNDASYLAEQLSSFSAAHTAANATSRLKIEADIEALNAFARRAYGREMDNQRTILRDLLDGAQGFNSCTEPPFAAACADAVSGTVDRIRDVSRMWTGVLSKGALLQSLGSLLSEVVSKVVLEVEELGDIGEHESAKLKEFCTTISTLSGLFMSNPGGAGEPQDMTGVYTPQWFKFLYLGEILEASLADIKYLWQQGELSLEFEKEELIDLMTALFAESDYRRRAIAEIRRS